MLDGDDGALDYYTELTGRAFDRAAIEFYGLAWTLSDVASFTALFRAEHVRTGWTELKWNGFVHLLQGGASAPYGDSG